MFIPYTNSLEENLSPRFILYDNLYSFIIAFLSFCGINVANNYLFKISHLIHVYDGCYEVSLGFCNVKFTLFEMQTLQKMNEVPLMFVMCVMSCL